MELQHFKKQTFLLGFFLLVCFASPVRSFAQSSTDFTIAQVIINSCLGYIEVSVQQDPAHTVVYKWYQKDSSGNYVVIPDEDRRILNANPGEYRVEVTNETTGQVITGDYMLNSAFPLTVSDMFSGLICNNDPNSGAILVFLDNGSSPYQYTLTDSNGNVVVVGTTSLGQATILIENLVAGTYTLDWQDNFGCTGTTSIEVDIPTDLIATASTVSPLCFGGTGEMTFSVNGGWGADYKVQLLDENGSPVILNGFTNINSADGIYYNIGTGQNISIDGLPAGMYSLKFFDEPLKQQYINRYAFDVTNTQLCIRSIDIEITEPDELLVLNENAVVTNNTCFDSDDGSILLTPTGGTAPYTYAWTTTNGTITSGEETTNALTNLPPGTYDVTITDANLCTFSNTYSITEPDQLTLSLSTFSAISCNGGNDGELVVQVQGGSPNYIFTLNGVTTTPTNTSGDLYTFSGLSAASYTLSVTDANNCSSVLPQITQTLAEPQPLTTTTNDFALACFGDSNGVIDGTISGGTAPYTIINDQNSQSISVTTDGGSFSFTGLSAGNYTFTITDANNSTGAVGCSTTASASITEPAELTATATTANNTCFNSDDGSILLTPTGGTAPYTYAWTTTNGTITSGEETTNALTNLPPGTYDVTITDANLCTFSNTYSITEPDQLTLSLSTFSAISCNGGNDGELVVQVQGGSPNYIFTLNGVTTTPTNTSGDLYTFSGLSAASYTLSVTDANNCSSVLPQITQTLAEPQPLTTTTNDFALACFGDSNGVIDGTISGGTAPYTIINDQNSQSISVTTDGGSFSFTGLSAGNYTFTITDANNSTGAVGCSTTASASITEPAELTATATTANNTCFNSDDGSILLTPTGGTAPYTYAWTTTNGTITSGEETTNALSNLPSGTYDVTITDANLCTFSNTYSITEPGEINLSSTVSTFDSGTETPINISCNGASDGFINITPSGGTTPYTFQWTASNGGVIPTGQENNQNLSGLVKGTYSVVLTDANNCTIPSTDFDLTEPRLLSGSASVIQSNECFDGALGIIETTIDGTGSVDGINYTYVISGANLPSGYTTSETTTALINRFENLPAGDFTVAVTDANGCDFTTTQLTISQPSNPITISETISDNNGFNVSCFGETDASISLTVTGGTPGSGATPYTYQWTSPSGAIIPTGQENTNSLSGIGSGTYEITITDGTGNCSITETYTITQPNDITLSGTTSDYNGFGVSAASATDGSIDLTVNGGVDTQVYTYSWSTANGTIPSGQDNVEDPSGLSEGTYSVLVTDANNCTETETFIITEPQELLISEVIASHQDVDCFGDSTGIIEISVDQESVPPYDYLLSQAGATVQSINTSLTNHTFQNLVAGTYDISVTDTNGAQKTLNGIVITQPANAFEATIVTSSFTGPNGTFEVSCFGNADGVIDVALSGGTTFDQGLPTAYYNYTLTNSSGVVVNNGQGININIPNLLADTYTFTAIDATGNCTVNETIILSEPDELIITTDLFQDIQCFGANDGIINVSISGGLGNNSISWTKDGNAFSTQEDIDNLMEGTYVLLIEDSVANSCDASQSFIVTEPAAFTATLDNKTDVLCYGDATGEINVTVSGGTPIPANPNQYQFVWTHNSGTTYTTEDLSSIPAGIYNLVATDANGCDATLQVTITQPTQIVFNPTTTDITCYGYDDGSIIINPTGGVTPYAITWSDLGNGTTRTNLSPGTYTVTITDATGCIVSEDIEIIDAPIFSLQGSTATDISCFGENDGSIDLTVTGGVAQLQLTWNDDPSAGIQRNNLAAGIYEVEVVDADNCIQRATFVINEPQDLALSAQITDAIDCTDPNSGAIDLIVTGGTLPYSFSWSNGSTSEDLTAIPANNYSVTITDANGCMISDAYQVIRQEPLEANVVTTIISECDTKEVSQENELIITGGFPPYTISWSYGEVDSITPTIMRTDINGTAVATITDDNGCVITQNIAINLLQLGDPEFTMDSSFQTDYSVWAIDDPISFTNISTGDAQGFLWDFGDGTTATIENPTHTYVSEGTYQITFTVSYAYGCTYTIQRTIEVVKGYEIEVPNAFTPNKDGVNDVFRPVYLGMQQVKIRIYDTWGGLLYTEESTTNIFNGWDGTLNGKPLENGNYIYQVDAISRNGIEIQKTGPFTLLK